MQKSDIKSRELIRKNLYSYDEDIIISKSPFSSFQSKEEDELVYKGSKGFLSKENIILRVQMNHLNIKDDNTFDLEILLALEDLEFASSRMITMYLNLKGIDKHQQKVQKRLSVMQNLKIISSYAFVSKTKEGKEQISHSSIYFLDIGAKFIFDTLEKKNSLILGNIMKSKNGIKQILIRNQTTLKFLYATTNIEFTSFKPIFRLINKTTYKPDLQMVFNHKNTIHHTFFEMVRSYEGWEAKLIEKLGKAKAFIETFQKTQNMPTKPIIILVAEDDNHALKIMKQILTNELEPTKYEYLFTTDNRILTSEINNSAFRFSINENKATIKILDIAIFEKSPL